MLTRRERRHRAEAGSHAVPAGRVESSWAAGVAVHGVGGDAFVGSVSCPSAGNCAADGPTGAAP